MLVKGLLLALTMGCAVAAPDDGSDSVNQPVVRGTRAGRASSLVKEVEDPCRFQPCPIVSCPGQQARLVPGTEGNCCGGDWECVGSKPVAKPVATITAEQEQMYEQMYENTPATVDIQTRFADLGGCGAARTCPDCTADLSCMWSVSGCTKAATFQTSRQWCSPVPRPDTVKSPCETFSECGGCTQTAGCIWYRAQCVFSSGTGCLEDPANCVNYPWQCPAPGADPFLNLNTYSNTGGGAGGSATLWNMFSGTGSGYSPPVLPPQTTSSTLTNFYSNSFPSNTNIYSGIPSNNLYAGGYGGGGSSIYTTNTYSNYNPFASTANQIDANMRQQQETQQAITRLQLEIQSLQLRLQSLQSEASSLAVRG